MVERRRGHGVPQAAVALDDKGRALEAMLPEILKEFQPDMGAAVDLVVVTVKPRDVASVCRVAKESPQLAFDFLLCLSVVDYGERLQVVYHLYSTTRKHKMVVKADVLTEEARVPSVTPVWPGADWFEREGHDLYGVVFEGHPNMSPLLLYEGFEGFPGRRSYPFNEYTEW
ncbi:MAG: NADH-ubiquinone oxidoreductase chain [Dehalococcoidia bacterium]|nr:NADH-ubiquinone oxidoreductase chain [Dehalococcoidia bacterium]